MGHDPRGTPDTTWSYLPCVLLLAARTAMRRGEICSVLWADVHLKEQWLHLPRTDDRLVPCNPDTLT